MMNIPIGCLRLTPQPLNESGGLWPPFHLQIQGLPGIILFEGRVWFYFFFDSRITFFIFISEIIS